jgi:hypothetical protein
VIESGSNEKDGRLESGADRDVGRELGCLHAVLALASENSGLWWPATEDATLSKDPRDGTTKVHVRFKGGRFETLTTVNPKPSWQKVKTPPEIVQLVDRLLDEHL